MSGTDEKGNVTEETAALSLRAAAYAIVEAARGTVDRNIKLRTPADEKGDSFYIAILKPEEMELVLTSREVKEG